MLQLGHRRVDSLQVEQAQLRAAVSFDEALPVSLRIADNPTSG
jgi:hypothetical protein